jgi:hypothetical protein
MTGGSSEEKNLNEKFMDASLMPGFEHWQPHLLSLFDDIRKSSFATSQLARVLCHEELGSGMGSGIVVWKASSSCCFCLCTVVILVQVQICGQGIAHTYSSNM